MSTLHDLARTGDIDGVRQAIERGADVNARNAHGDTSLHLAASHGRPEIAGLLLQSGANVNLKNKYGVTPLHCAASSAFCRTETIGFLLQNGADVNARNAHGDTSFEIVMKEGGIALLHAFCTVVVGNILDAQDAINTLREREGSAARQALSMIEAMMLAEIPVACESAQQAFPRGF